MGTHAARPAEGAGLVRALLAALVVLAAAGGAARADDDKVKAIALFDEGQKEMRAGNFAKACKAFEASNRILPDSGTRGSLARCYTQLGRTASAWTLWRELSDTAPSADLRADAAGQAQKLEARLAKYTVKVAAPADGVVVTLEGKPVDATIDVPVPIDPGTYPVEASAPGRVAWKGQLVAAEGKIAVIEVPALAAAPAGGPKGPDKPPVVSRGRGRRIAGLALAGVGIGGLVVGGVFGAKARSTNEDAKELCGGDIDRCDPARTNEAQAKVDDARSAANLSTVGFIAGGALVATGVILFVTAPKAERRAVAVSPLVGGGASGIVLSGRF